MCEFKGEISWINCFIGNDLAHSARQESHWTAIKLPSSKIFNWISLIQFCYTNIWFRNVCIGFYILTFLRAYQFAMSVLSVCFVCSVTQPPLTAYNVRNTHEYMSVWQHTHAKKLSSIIRTETVCVFVCFVLTLNWGKKTYLVYVIPSN